MTSIRNIGVHPQTNVAYVTPIGTEVAHYGTWVVTRYSQFESNYRNVLQ